MVWGVARGQVVPELDKEDDPPMEVVLAVDEEDHVVHVLDEGQAHVEEVVHQVVVEVLHENHPPELFHHVWSSQFPA